MKNIIVLVLLVPFAVFSQTAPDTTAAPADSSGEKILLDKINITGELEKPQAVFILPGSETNVEDIQIERSFLKEIFRPVEKTSVLPREKKRPESK